MVPAFATMRSGRRCIVLEEGITYDSFPAAAGKWAAKLELAVEQKIDGPDSRLWVCGKHGKKFWLAYDEWISAISLEPQDADAEGEILQIGTAIGALQKSGHGWALRSGAKVAGA